VGGGNEPGVGGNEPGVGGNEPGVSGNDRSPGGGPGNTIPELCAFDCRRIEMTCPGSSSANCAGDCAGDFSTIPVACSDLAFQFLRCVATDPLSCVNGDVSFPTCETALLYLSYCLSSVAPPPTTGGGTPTGGV